MDYPESNRSDDATGNPAGEPSAAVLESRRRPMAERLELALSWNLMASELKVGMAEARKNTAPSK